MKENINLIFYFFTSIDLIMNLVEYAYILLLSRGEKKGYEFFDSNSSSNDERGYDF